MPEAALTTPEYKLFQSPRNRHREVFLHEVFVPHPYALIDLPSFHLKGKSSLFALLTDRLQSDKGEVDIPRQWAVGEVAQNMPETESRSATRSGAGSAASRRAA